MTKHFGVAPCTTRPLGEIATIERNAIAPERIPNGALYVGLEHMTSDGDFLGVAPVRNGTLASTKYRFTDRHILYGKLRPYLAKIARPGFAGVCSTDILPILPGADVDRAYLCHYLRQPEMVALANSRTSGANLPRLSPHELAKFQVPLPSLPEQKRIADILDKADATRRKRQEVSTMLENYPLALFMQVFGHPDPNPKDWPMRPFFKVCDSRLGKMIDAKKQTGRHNRPYMRNLNVQWGRLDLAQIFEMDFDESDRDEFRLRYGDVLICEGGAGVGQTAIWRDELPECYFQKSLHRVRPFPDTATPEYIAYLMWTLMKGSSLRRSISSATIPHLTGEKLKDIQIPIPPLKLQQHFSAQCSRVRTASEKAVTCVGFADVLFNALVQRAFSGKF